MNAQLYPKAMISHDRNFIGDTVVFIMLLCSCNRYLFIQNRKGLGNAQSIDSAEYVETAGSEPQDTSMISLSGCIENYRSTVLCSFERPLVL